MAAHAHKDEDGNVTVTYKAYTFEAMCALLEQKIREWKWEPIRIWIPKLASVGSLFQPSPFLFAIAFDTTALGSAGSGDVTVSYTCTGSNLSLGANGGTANGSLTYTSTYNSVSMTAPQATISLANGQEMQGFHLTAPSTGAHNAVFHASGTTGSADYSLASYTGVKQTGQPKTSQNDAPANSLNYSKALTIATTNSWLVGCFYANTAPTAGTNTVIRQPGSLIGDGWSDSNSAQASGSRSLAWTSGNSNTTWGSCLMELEVVVAATAAQEATPFLSQPTNHYRPDVITV